MTLVMQQDAPLYGLLTIGEELDLLDPFSALIFLSCFERHLKVFTPQDYPTEEVFNRALEEACKPIAVYNALLQIAEEREKGYYVGDYVSDYLESQGYEIVEERWILVSAAWVMAPERSKIRRASPRRTL
jgi:hypothetical protein